MTQLERLQIELWRISEHRTKGAEAEIKKLYKKLLNELQEYVGAVHAANADDDGFLFRTTLHRNRNYARFLEVVNDRLDGVAPSIVTKIDDTVSKIYKLNYDGFVDAVKKSSTSEIVKERLKHYGAITSEAIKRGVENPVKGLTLNKTLEKHRRQIIYDIKKNVNIGLMNGDRYSTMANRLKNTLDGDYKKSMRIIRTETHRVQEAGQNDAAMSMADELEQAGFVIAKRWKCVNDERVREEHNELDGQAVKIQDAFVYKGMEAQYPGGFGVAHMDINCRCKSLRKTITIEGYNEKYGHTE